MSSLIVMLAMPALGAYADRSADEKRPLVLSTLGRVVGAAALAGAGPGDVAWALLAIALSYVFYSYGESLIAAFLPELVRQDRMGSVSGWGWRFGYLGGMLTQGLSLWSVLRALGQGLPWPSPWLDHHGRSGHRPRAVLGGGRDRWLGHGQQPVGGPRGLAAAVAANGKTPSQPG